ncbi:hypothetical protein D3C81_1362400 [compost metagenome]
MLEFPLESRRSRLRGPDAPKTPEGAVASGTVGEARFGQLSLAVETSWSSSKAKGRHTRQITRYPVVADGSNRSLAAPRSNAPKSQHSSTAQPNSSSLPSESESVGLALLSRARNRRYRERFCFCTATSDENEILTALVGGIGKKQAFFHRPVEIVFYGCNLASLRARMIDTVVK